MKRIKLTQSKFAIVDDADFERLNQGNWRLRKNRYTDYAMGTICGQQDIYMHRQIMNPPDSMEVDHKNHNVLDNIT